MHSRHSESIACAEFGAVPGNDLRIVKREDSATQICDVLRRLQAQHCLLTVQVGDLAEFFTSVILEVVREGEYLVLDALTPSEGNARLRAVQQIKVRGILDGIEVRFASRVTQINTQNGLPYYKVLFPTLIDYPQRRQVHRVPIPLNRGFPASLLMADERILSGELRDISPEGLGIRVRTGTIDLEADHHTLAICQLLLQPSTEFVADILLCHIDPPVRGRVPRLGARFIGLSAKQIRRIEQLCAELARKQRSVR